MPQQRSVEVWLYCSTVTRYNCQWHVNLMAYACQHLVHIRDQIGYTWCTTLSDTLTVALSAKCKNCNNNRQRSQSHNATFDRHARAANTAGRRYTLHVLCLNSDRTLLIEVVRLCRYDTGFAQLQQVCLLCYSKPYKKMKIRNRPKELCHSTRKSTTAVYLYPRQSCMQISEICTFWCFWRYLTAKMGLLSSHYFFICLPHSLPHASIAM